jgi:hypothetical protein
MVGVNGKYLISVGTTNVHSYSIESNGAVGKQAAVIDTQDYSGSECGATSAGGSSNGAYLDHTGKYFYVQLYDGSDDEDDGGDCAAWQSYQVESNGNLVFLGSVEDEGWSDHYATPSSVPTVSSNDLFSYGVFYQFDGFSYTTFSTFSRTPSSGFLEINNNFSGSGPEANPNAPNGPWYFVPLSVKADNSSDLAVLMQSFWVDDDANQKYGPNQMASFKIDNATGGIVSTNTWENMPIPAITGITDLNMSPTGKLLAVFGYPGLQLFHFNGASPITPYSGVLLPTTDIDQVAWDNDNHMYALSYQSQKLYVYTVTPTTITAVAGSPYTVTGAYGSHGLIVVPK